MKSMSSLLLGTILIIVGIAAFIFFFPRFDKGPGGGLPSGVPQWLALPFGIVAAVSKEIASMRVELFDNSMVKFKSSAKFDVRRGRSSERDTEVFEVSPLVEDLEPMGLVKFTFVPEKNLSPSILKDLEFPNATTHLMADGASLRIAEYIDPAQRSWEAQPGEKIWQFVVDGTFPGKVWGRVFSSRANVSELSGYLEQIYLLADWKGKSDVGESKEMNSEKRARNTSDRLIYNIDPTKNIFSAFVGKVLSVSPESSKMSVKILSSVRVLDGPNKAFQAQPKGEILELEKDSDSLESLRGSEGRLLFFTSLRDGLRDFAFFPVAMEEAQLKDLLKTSTMIVGEIQNGRVKPHFSYDPSAGVNGLHLSESFSEENALGVFLISKKNEQARLAHPSAFALFSTED